MEYIEIDKDLIPYEFIIELDNDEYKLDVRYNETYDFFTVDLYKDEQLIVAGEKLVYGQALFASTYDPRTHPAQTIVPLDLSNHESTVTWATLNETVFLILQNGGESIG
ncbi:phage baseplate plug protein [Kurthia populi]|uniref:Phage baseplate plug protein n=1 Tax=Kurthia populi TaxID=1562132 RepID=A0ABW5XWU1_9BACL